MHFPKNHDMIFSTSAMGKCLIMNRVICLGHNDLNIDGGRCIMQELEKTTDAADHVGKLLRNIIVKYA